MPARKPKTPRTRDQIVSFDAKSDSGKERMIAELARRGSDVETRLGALETGALGGFEARLDALEASQDALEAEVESIVTSGPVPSSRTISTIAPLSGGGDLTADRTLSLNGRVLLARQVLTASGTYTPTGGARAVRLCMVGGGGGGGGAKGGAGHAVAAGGSSGLYIDKWIDSGSAITGGAVTIGAAGTAGSGSTPGVGGTGGTTSILINGHTYQAFGGPGGAAMNNTAGSDWTSPTALPSAPIAGDADVYTSTGGLAGFTTGSLWIAGNGGSSPFGMGGITQISGSPANGGAAQGYGAGGAGGYGTASNCNGGVGTAGIAIIEEYA